MLQNHTQTLHAKVLKRLNHRRPLRTREVSLRERVRQVTFLDLKAPQGGVVQVRRGDLQPPPEGRTPHRPSFSLSMTILFLIRRWKAGLLRVDGKKELSSRVC